MNRLTLVRHWIDVACKLCTVGFAPKMQFLNRFRGKLYVAVPRRGKVDVSVQTHGKQAAHVADGQTHTYNLTCGASHKAYWYFFVKFGCTEQCPDVLTQPIPTILRDRDGAGTGEI